MLMPVPSYGVGKKRARYRRIAPTVWMTGADYGGKMRYFGSMDPDTGQRCARLFLSCDEAEQYLQAECLLGFPVPVTVKAISELTANYCLHRAVYEYMRPFLMLYGITPSDWPKLSSWAILRIGTPTELQQ
jgi:hypothetical protein